MKTTLLFDLGNTLVQYYTRAEFPALLEQAIKAVQAHLSAQSLLRVSPEALRQAVAEENYEAADHAVRPLEGRLARIFRLSPDECARERDALCGCFMEPLLAPARRYEDTLPTLQALRAQGLRVAVLSNTPWGSPAGLWHAELARHGLTPWLDLALFCVEVGWRKPAPPIFEAALARLGARPQECLFVGDDPRWDLAGPRALGIEALLIARPPAAAPAREPALRSLNELVERL